MKISLIMLSILIGPLTVACGPTTGAISQLKQSLSSSADPLGMDQSYLRNFESLPLSGSVADSNVPWSDFSWPSNQAGLANRWADEDSLNNFEFDLYSFDDISSMTMEETLKLSPAEKFDLLTGRYDYPTVASEWGRNSEGAEDDDGLRNGWAAASLNFQEPKSLSVKNDDGIEIQFFSADIKALLSYYQGQIAFSRTVQLGEKCRVDFDKLLDKACKETDPGAFHMVLANELGRFKKGFILDAKQDQAETSWNFPAHGFVARIVNDDLSPSPLAIAGTEKEVEIETTVTLADTAPAMARATNGTKDHNEVTIVYRYRLQLDAKGYILGGTWLGTQRPDSLWRQDKPVFEKEFSKLRSLYEASIK